MVSAGDIGVVADDLTGACDVAACFSKTCGPIDVYVSPESVQASGSRMCVINTQSRLKSPDSSSALLYSVGQRLKGKPVIFKKIDTALRGSAGAELKGLIRAVGLRDIIIAPAIPGIGRITKGGIQYDNGVPIDKTDYADDPVSPVTGANIRDVINRTCELDFKVFDAENEEDLTEIIRIGLGKPGIVFVGSIGLADALASKIEKTGTVKKEFYSSKNILIVCGSKYNKALLQLKEAAHFYGIGVTEVGPAKNQVLEPDCFKDQKICIIRLASEADAPELLQASGLAEWFADKINGIVEALKPDSLGVIGGETFFHVLKKLGTGKISVKGRVTDVMPYGDLVDGKLGGFAFVSKGGSVGNDDAVIRMIGFLKGE
jgi:uncharacterized protein YgbK (DUF1537 family)